MNWTLIAIVAVVSLAVVIAKRLTAISPEQARDLLQEGAVLVDVRSAEEFSSGHLRALRISRWES